MKKNKKGYTPEEFEKLPEDQKKSVLAGIEQVQKEQKEIVNEESSMKKLSKEEFEGMVSEQVRKAIEPMTNVDRKYFVFPGIGKEGLDDKTDEGKFVKTQKFFKAMIGGDVQTCRAMHDEAKVKANLSEGTTTAGGYLVPDEFKAEILRLAPTYGVIRRESRAIPMMTDVLNIPSAGTTDQSAIWTNEAAQILQTNPTFDQITLTINKLAAIPKVTNELLADAQVPIIQYLAELIAEQFAKAEDEQGFNGTGSPFTGVLAATGVPTTPHAGGTGFICLSYADLATATGNIYDTALANAKFYFNRTLVAHIRSRITTTGAPIFDPTTRTLLGYPLVWGERLPGLSTSTATTDATAYAIFGDLRKAILFGERGSIQMKISDQATVDSDNLFEKDMSALRMIERVAIGVALPSAFTRIVS